MHVCVTQRFYICVCLSGPQKVSSGTHSCVCMCVYVCVDASKSARESVCVGR